MLDLGLSPEQEQLQDAVAGLLERACATEVVRAAEPLGYDAGLWDKVRELGVVDMAVPEGAGGSGASLLDAALVGEVAGAALAPVPLVESVVSARLLAAVGTPAARALLDAVLTGTTSITVALRPPDSSGTARWVPWGAVAERVLVPDGQRLLATTGPAPGVNIPNLGDLPVADRDVEPGAEVLGEGREVAAAVHRALDEWRVLTAAVLCGAGRRALEIGIAYTVERHQFGVPIGSFQSVAHHLADDATAMDGAQLLVREAAWSADEDPEQFAVLAPMAFAFAAETAEQAADSALHFHGGYGFMLEYDIQLYFRRIKAWALLDGDGQAELGRLADALWGGKEN
jgi:alkylation response protein AidB-like acyl-CoA dehydrogenase